MPESDKPRKPYDPTKRQRKFAAESNGAKAPHHPVARAKHLRGRPGILIATGSLTTGATVGYLLGRHSRKERAGVIKLYDPFTESTVDFEKVSVGGVVEGAKDVARAGQTAAVTGGRQLKAFATSKPVLAASAGTGAGAGAGYMLGRRGTASKSLKSFGRGAREAVEASHPKNTARAVKWGNAWGGPSEAAGIAAGRGAVVGGTAAAGAAAEHMRMNRKKKRVKKGMAADPASGTAVRRVSPILARGGHVSHGQDLEHFTHSVSEPHTSALRMYRKGSSSKMTGGGKKFGKRLSTQQGAAVFAKRGTPMSDVARQSRIGRRITVS